MHSSLTYDEGQKGLALLLSLFLYKIDSDFIVVSPPIYEVLRNFTKLIDKKLKWYTCTTK